MPELSLPLAMKRKTPPFLSEMSPCVEYEFAPGFSERLNAEGQLAITTSGWYVQRNILLDIKLENQVQHLLNKDIKVQISKPWLK